MSLDQPQPRLVRRRAASQYLQDRWAMRASEQTLAKYAGLGCGPEFQRYSRDVVYDVQKLDEWARSRLSKPVRSTSETDLSATRNLDEAHDQRIDEAETTYDDATTLPAPNAPTSARRACRSKVCFVACKRGAGPP